MNGLEVNARPNALLRAADIAEQLGISTASVYRRRSLGEPLPPAIKIGGSVRWKQSDVDAWIDSQREER
ncbi:helix-turn-helix transcriptional regulator [Leucobacter chromiiresistens]|uniref:Predicted DNA-binding transcriptional regulator AlpA n=1 Tax=Leucobacter chromiiresistens TaxID=1079994 RepID=A0A1H1BC97_9MICO|nr:Predicted DNA-binding transcriptional regulator AlpA [Leucobacter chromiiresistens]